MNPVLNISAYLFVAIDAPEALREQVASLAAAHALHGTVLIAREGINLFVAGDAGAVRAFVEALRTDPRLAALAPKESWSTTVPFRKMLVKVKPEIIRMDHPTIRPQIDRAPAIDATTLARWLDAGVDDDGREVVTLDTRNAFEVGHGRFRGAIDWQIERFSEFPAAVSAHAGDLQGKTVVTYCTGGIRCEKAALYMADAGIERVVQLEGGILKYFEQVGDRHFEGTCFVFDARRELDAALSVPSA